MSSRDRVVAKSYSESQTASGNPSVNGFNLKSNLMKQEEIDPINVSLESNNISDPQSSKTSMSSHSISICIDGIESSTNEQRNMRQELAKDIDHQGSSSEISNLENGINLIKIEDAEKDEEDSFRQSNEAHQITPNVASTVNEFGQDSKDKKRAKHLVRCEAVRESSLSPPPPTNGDHASHLNNKASSSNLNHLAVYNKNVSNSKSQSSLKSNSTSGASSPSLSRESSAENNLELSIAELQTFFASTLKKNQKDRMYLRRTEQEIMQLIKDDSKESHKFSANSSYNRLLIHRLAAYYGLEHNVDHTYTSVVVNKTKNTHLPEVRIKDLFKEDESLEAEPRAILKRGSSSMDDSSGGSSFDKDKSPESSHLNGSLSDSSRSRSLEEREENYERVRARIFSNESAASKAAAANDKSNVSPKVSIDNIDLKVNDICANTAITHSSPDNIEPILNECDKVEPSKTLETNISSNVPVAAKNESKNSGRNTSGNSRPKSGNSKRSYSDRPNHSNGGRDRGGYHCRKNLESVVNCYKPNDTAELIHKAKLASQSLPYSLLYAGHCVDGNLNIPRYPFNPYANQGAPFNPLSHHNYMHPPPPPPLLPITDQLFQQTQNYVNPPPMLPSALLNSTSANVPSSILPLNYQAAAAINGMNPTSPTNISLSNNYNQYQPQHQQQLYNSIQQPICGGNSTSAILPYSPSTSSIAQNTQGPFHSLLSYPYQHYQQQTLSTMNNPLLPGSIASNYKNPLFCSGESDKGGGGGGGGGHLKNNLNYAKTGPMPQSLGPAGAYQYTCSPPDLLDRNLAANAAAAAAASSVQYNQPLTGNYADMMLANNRNPHLINSFNYSNMNGKREMMNLATIQQHGLTPAAMFLNQHPRLFYGNQPPPKSTAAGGGGGSKCGSNRNRRGPLYNRKQH